MIERLAGEGRVEYNVALRCVARNASQAYGLAIAFLGEDQLRGPTRSSLRRAALPR
jgi:hypothetical protein